MPELSQETGWGQVRPEERIGAGKYVNFASML